MFGSTESWNFSPSRRDMLSKNKKSKKEYLKKKSYMKKMKYCVKDKKLSQAKTKSHLIKLFKCDDNFQNTLIKSKFNICDCCDNKVSHHNTIYIFDKPFCFDCSYEVYECCQDCGKSYESEFEIYDYQCKDCRYEERLTNMRRRKYRRLRRKGVKVHRLFLLYC